MSNSSLDSEVYSQPDCWSTAAEYAPRYASSLPAPGERVAVIGCGTSHYIARAYAFAREGAGHGDTDAWPGGEARLGRDYDRLLVICRSGTTTEILDALDQYKDRGGTAPATIVTATPGTPVHSRGEAITLAEFDEASVVMTRFATGTLALLRAHLGEDIAPAIADARAVLAEDPEVSLAAVRKAEQISFVGMGLGAALAEEAALKLRESTRSWAEAYHATEYRHGPISIAAPGTVTWMLGESPRGLSDQVEATGAQWIDVCATGRDPLAELIRAQRLAVALGAKKGLEVDNPRNLTRSVILSEV